MKRILKTLLPYAVAFLLSFVVYASQSRLDSHHEIRFVTDSPEFLPKGGTLKWLSMGHRGMLADWIWIHSVLYYGRRSLDEDNPYLEYSEQNNPGELNQLKREIPEPDIENPIQQELHHLLYQYKNVGLVDYIYPMLDRETTLDPYFIFPYIFGSVYVLMDTGEIDASLNLLWKGRKANPRRWEFPFYLGWIHWVYLNKPEATYEFLRDAVTLPDCPEHILILFSNFSKNLDKVDITERYLHGLIESADNIEFREQIQTVLNAMKDISQKSDLQ